MDSNAAMLKLSEPTMGEAKRRKESKASPQRFRVGLSNRKLLEASEWCGCGYCCMMFPSAEIKHWIEEPNGDQSAQCPYCSVDIVLGDAMMSNFGYPVLLQICSERFGHEQFKKMCRELGTSSRAKPQWRNSET